MKGFIIFSDLKGYSRLSENEAQFFFTKLNPILSAKIKPYLLLAEAFNTWGDALIAVFSEGKYAIDLMLSYRDFFNKLDFKSYGMTRLMPRIGGHFGELYTFRDEVLERTNMYGINVNTAARIEPITRAGEIFVTKQFKEAIEQSAMASDYISFDELGFVELAKGFDERELFRLRYDSENPQVIDKIFALDLSGAFPPSPNLTAEEKDILDIYSHNGTDLTSLLGSDRILDRTGEFYFQLAKICKTFGLYNDAITLLRRLENYFIETAGLKMYPYKSRQDVLKLKANCLTRLGLYQEASDIIYSLWQQGMKDSDTLSMLAAQYKRRALPKSDDSICHDLVNRELLIKAKDLYLEAFRRNIEDYYPAINAAYLYRILGGSDSDNGIKLARYVMDSWQNRQGENWWLDSTLAESQILQDSFIRARETFANAIKLHQPDSFERSATINQISTYAILSGKESQLKELIYMLSQL
ncbi:MAG: adenylate/guanylate cyclase domain-containing protein [Syntrophomonas sp.]|nr:adenylate/guanylate cyclase domain-containing protein [Syntrophomonas sp.]